MPADVHASIAGHYTATWDGTSLGLTEEGWFIEISVLGEVVTFEEFADNEIDMISRGAQVTIEGTLKEVNEAAINLLLWPFHSTIGKVACSGEFAVNGDYAKALVLTAETCSNAVPASFTFLKTILEPGYASRINLDNRPRLMPVRFKSFLYNNGTTTTPDYRYFTTS